MAEYRIDDLARAADTTVRNVRAYQDRGLLAPPRRQGRVALYDDRHLARLKLINQLLDRGYPLGAIRELTEAWDGGRSLGAVLGLVSEMRGPWSDEVPERLDRPALLAMFAPAVTDEGLAAAVGGGRGEAAGGGGRGMRVAHYPKDLVENVKMATREAEAAFGNGEVYLEKYLEEPRHIEIQIVADRHGHIVHLGERDCSVQRRHQKLLEESPSPVLTEELRARMGAAAIQAARAVAYEGVGTIEFLLDKHMNFYFMEMNTRIQVEHPVTELVTGLDLVREQLRIAAGEPLGYTQEDVRFSGHAIECRINAEDPDRDFQPSPGVIQAYVAPGGPGVRVDSHAYPGYAIPPYYDSLIGKLIVWAPDRKQAIDRMMRALGEYAITGVKTTIPLQQKILGNAFFRAGEVYTNFVQRRILGG
ncbi:MAG: MerR family transcriptional regulator [Candidatus Sericytochromatia bacterium]